MANIINVFPDDYQKTRGLYSPAKIIDLGEVSLIFVSGHQAEKDPETHEIIMEDIEAQSISVFESLSKTLGAAGASFSDVVQVKMYLKDIGDYDKVEQIMINYLPEDRYVFTLAQMQRGTRIGSKIEVEVTAFKLNKSKESERTFTTNTL